MASAVRNWFNFTTLKKWLTNINPIKTKSLPQPEDYLTKTLGKYEPYVFYLQNILIWDDPIISSFSILVVNIMFWIVFNFELRFYGVIFTTLTAWICYEAWVHHVWPEISVPSPQKTEHLVYSPQHPSGVLSVPEISSYVTHTVKLVKQYCFRLRKLRSEQPGMFCCEMGSMFACLAMLGRSVSGPLIVYSFLMTAMIAPGVWIHVLPPAVKDKVVETVTYFQAGAHTGDLDLDDMIPESTHENLELFHLAGEPDSSDKEDSTEFAFDPDATDDPMSLNSPRETDDIAQMQLRLAERLGRSSSSSSDEIRFRSSHFDGSSSEEEEAFARGMKFTEPAPQTTAQANSVAAASLLGNLGSLLATVMTRPAAVTTPRRRSSSDLEDFEIIDASLDELS